ncbi:MAG: DUF488 domain-containing protein [Nitrospirae bacterium]|nr:DUF488 domain-containing protein [Candidatus Manganitrophaceae bacterium]
MDEKERETLYTLGHSTRTEEAFLALLTRYQIQLLVDVRTVPRSRRVPQFNREHLHARLPTQGVAYLHHPALGGLRKGRDSDRSNQGWRNASFRGYADYMQTEAFREGIDLLLSECRGKKTALMCAEAVPWKCHRSLISDALVVRGVTVCHILSLTDTKVHQITPFAKVEGARITYPGSEEQPSLF